MTEKEIDALQETKLDRATPFAISGVSNTQLSVARYFGGCKFQGRNYLYLPETDELLRDDVVKWLKKYRKAQEVDDLVAVDRQTDLLNDLDGQS